MLGKHNVLNAAAALIVCLNLGANLNIAKKSLKNFSGVQRRLTKVFKKDSSGIPKGSEKGTPKGFRRDSKGTPKGPQKDPKRILEGFQRDPKGIPKRVPKGIRK